MVDNARLNPNLKTLTDAIIRETALRVRTCVPARVLDYHDGPPATAKLEISAQQVERDRDGNEGARQAFIVDDVPVWQYGGKSSYIRTPLETDDTGVILVCDRSIGSWRTDGLAHPPPAPWLHNLGECVFLPGFRPDPDVYQPPLASMGGMVIEAQAIQLGVDADQAAVLGTLFGSMWDAVIAALKAHVHPGVTVGGGTTGPSVDLTAALNGIPATSTVLSTKVFVSS